MKKVLFIKPDLTHFFGCMPAIGMWMLHDYNKAQTKDELYILFNEWLEVSETSRNATKQWCYNCGAHYLYSLLSGKSYESTLNID